MNYKSRKYKKVKKSKKNIKRGGKRSHKKRAIKKSKLANRNYSKQSSNGNKKNISYFLSRGGKARYTVLRNEKSPTSYATHKRVKKTQLKKYRKPFGKHSLKGGAVFRGGPKKSSEKKAKQKAKQDAKTTFKENKKNIKEKRQKEIKKTQTQIKKINLQQKLKKQVDKKKEKIRIKKESEKDKGDLKKLQYTDKKKRKKEKDTEKELIKERKEALSESKVLNKRKAKRKAEGRSYFSIGNKFKSVGKQLSKLRGRREGINYLRERKQKNEKKLENLKNYQTRRQKKEATLQNKLDQIEKKLQTAKTENKINLLKEKIKVDKQLKTAQLKRKEADQLFESYDQVLQTKIASDEKRIGIRKKQQSRKLQIGKQKITKKLKKFQNLEKDKFGNTLSNKSRFKQNLGKRMQQQRLRRSLGLNKKEFKDIYNGKPNIDAKEILKKKLEKKANRKYRLLQRDAATRDLMQKFRGSEKLDAAKVDSSNIGNMVDRLLRSPEVINPDNISDKKISREEYLRRKKSSDKIQRLSDISSNLNKVSDTVSLVGENSNNKTFQKIKTDIKQINSDYKIGKIGLKAADKVRKEATKLRKEDNPKAVVNYDVIVQDQDKEAMENAISNEIGKIGFKAENKANRAKKSEEKKKSATERKAEISQLEITNPVGAVGARTKDLGKRLIGKTVLSEKAKIRKEISDKAKIAATEYIKNYGKNSSIKEKREMWKQKYQNKLKNTQPPINI